MNKLMIFLITLVIPVAFYARARKVLTLDEALKEKKVSVRLVSKGGYKGRVLSGKFINLTKDSLYIKIEPGRRFDSKDNKEQDLLMAEEMMLAFSAKQRKNAELKVFCCQAHNRSPVKDSIYIPGKMASQNLVELAEFISSEKFSDQAIQAAVWTVSDKNHPGSICDPNNVASAERLKSFTCDLIHYEPPWYHLEYNQTQNAEGYIDQRALKIYGEIYLENDTSGNLNAYITDSKGNRVVDFLSAYPVKKGAKNFNFDFSVDGWPRKDYNIIFCRDGKVIMEKAFSL